MTARLPSLTPGLSACRPCDPRPCGLGSGLGHPTHLHLGPVSAVGTNLCIASCLAEFQLLPSRRQLLPHHLPYLLVTLTVPRHRLMSLVWGRRSPPRLRAQLTLVKAKGMERCLSEPGFLFASKRHVSASSSGKTGGVSLSLSGITHRPRPHLGSVPPPPSMLGRGRVWVADSPGALSPPALLQLCLGTPLIQMAAQQAAPLWEGRVGRREVRGKKKQLMLAIRYNQGAHKLFGAVCEGPGPSKWLQNQDQPHVSDISVTR